MNDLLAPEVTAAELVRNFAAIRQRASAAPVFVTNHGKQSHVLCSVEQFRAFAERKGQAGAGEPPLDVVQLAAWIDQGLILVDAIGRVLHANAALLALAPYDPARLIGRDVFEAMPEWSGTLAEAYLRRAIGTRETALFEMASPFDAGRWLQCRLAPVGDRIALLIRDVTRDVRGIRGAGEGEAMLRALDQNDRVAVVRLSPCGAIETIHGCFAGLVGLLGSRLLGVRFADLVDAADRRAAVNAIEHVIACGDAETMVVRLLSRSGAPVRVRVGMARAGDGCRVEGVAMVLSRGGAVDDDAQAPRMLRHVGA